MSAQSTAPFDVAFMLYNISMEDKSVVSLLLIGMGIILVAIEAYNMQRQNKLKRQCTAHVQGQVIDYRHDKDLPLPVVQYVVNGVPHNVVGPEFKVSVYNPSDNNENRLNVSELLSRHRTGLEGATRETLPRKVTVYKKPVGATDVVNVLGSIGNPEALQQNVAQVATRDNPLLALYPIGSLADVYYDPSNPDLAYVQRPLGVTTIDYVLTAVGAIMAIIGIVMLVMSL